MAASQSVAAQSFTIGSIHVDFGDPARQPGTAAEKEFVAAYIRASRNSDLEGMRALVHPASLACASSPANTRHMNVVLSRPFRHTIPDDVKIALVPLPSAEQHIPKTDAMTLPVAPASMFVLDYRWQERNDTGQVRRDVGITVIRLLAPDGGALKLAEYCLTPRGEAMFEAKERGQPEPAR